MVDALTSSSGSAAMEIEMQAYDDDAESNDGEPTGFVYQPPAFVPTVETDAHKLAQRKKQIEFGKVRSDLL